MVLVISFLTLISVLSYGVVSGHKAYETKSYFYVSEITTDNPSKVIADVAKKHRVNFYKEITLESGEKGYVQTIGNSDEAPKTNSENIYRTFTNQKIVYYNVDDNNQINKDVRGYYNSSADSELLGLVLRDLEVAGVKTNNSALFGAELYLNTFFEVPAIPIIISMLILFSLSLLYQMLKNQKQNAIKYINGYTKTKINIQEISTIFILVLFYSISIFLLSTVILSMYNALNEFSSYAKIVTIFYLVFYAYVFIMFWLIKIFLPKTKLVQNTKKRDKFVVITVLSYFAQFICGLVIFITSVSVITQMSIISSDAHAISIWKQEKDLVALKFNFDIFGPLKSGHVEVPPYQQEVYQKYLELYEEADAKNDVILATKTGGYSEERITGLAENFNSGGNHLIINNAYLAKYPIYDSNGIRIKSLTAEEHKTYLLIPEKLKEYEDVIVEDAIDGVSLNGSLSTEVGIEAITFTPKIEVIYTKTNQKIFNIGESSGLADWIQVDPIIAVVSAKTGIYSGSSVAEVESNNADMLYTSKSVLEKYLKKYDLNETVDEITRVNGTYIKLYEKNQRALYVQIIGLILTVFAFFCSIFAMVSIYLQNNKMPIFLAKIFGYGFIKTHFAHLCINVTVTFISLEIAFIFIKNYLGARIGAVMPLSDLQFQLLIFFTMMLGIIGNIIILNITNNKSQQSLIRRY